MYYIHAPMMWGYTFKARALSVGELVILKFVFHILTQNTQICKQNYFFVLVSRTIAHNSLWGKI